MSGELEKLTPENKVVLTDAQWDAVAKLIEALGVTKEFEVDTMRGEKYVFDREEDRPLDTGFAIGLLAGMAVKPLKDYGLSEETVSVLNEIFGADR